MALQKSLTEQGVFVALTTTATTTTRWRVTLSNFHRKHLTSSYSILSLVYFHDKLMILPLQMLFAAAAVWNANELVHFWFGSVCLPFLLHFFFFYFYGCFCCSNTLAALVVIALKIEVQINFSHRVGLEWLSGVSMQQTPAPVKANPNLNAIA